MYPHVEYVVHESDGNIPVLKKLPRGFASEVNFTLSDLCVGIGANLDTICRFRQLQIENLIAALHADVPCPLYWFAVAYLLWGKARFRFPTVNRRGVAPVREIASDGYERRPGKMLEYLVRGLSAVLGWIVGLKDQTVRQHGPS